MTLYQIKLTTTNLAGFQQARPRFVWFSAATPVVACALAQALAQALQEIDRRLLVEGPKPVMLSYARCHLRAKGREHALDTTRLGVVCLDPLLLGEADYRAAYRACRIELVGYGGMVAEEETATLPF